MSNQIIRAAMETRLAAWAAALTPPMPVQFENDKTFERPSNGARYARCFLMPVDVEALTLDRQHRLYEGILQVTLCMPLGSGNGQADALVAELDAQFSPSHPIVYGGLTIVFTRPMSRASGIPEDDCYAVPVSCTYRCDNYPT